MLEVFPPRVANSDIFESQVISFDLNVAVTAVR